MGAKRTGFMGFVLAAVAAFGLMTASGCLVRTNARAHGVNHKHSHCHQKANKRDHRKGKHHKKVCHSHVHSHPHH